MISSYGLLGLGNAIISPNTLFASATNLATQLDVAMKKDSAESLVY